jgi:biopolymer transport protein ExbD
VKKPRFKPSGKSECSLDMTPMIDVTFQLISFFMFVLSVDDVEQNQAIRLPASEMAKPPERMVRTTFTVHITKPQEDDRSYVYFRGRRMLPDSAEFGDAIQLERRLLELEKKDPKEPNIVVLVRADEHARWGDVQEVVKRWQAAGFEHFPFRAEQRVDF